MLHAVPPVLAAFLASFVEFVEALTVILAVGSVRGWRTALSGAAVALLVLCAIVAILGPLLERVPLGAMRLAIGFLLLLFGLRWLRKAVLRSAGIVPLHDEAASFTKQSAAMREHGRAAGWDKLAFAATFNITMLEGMEVVFIVIGIGAGGGTGLLRLASLGALAALLVVAALGAVLYKPLTAVPENMLKFIVGGVLSALGTFWVGEGLGFTWPGADAAILWLIAGFLIIGWLAVPFCRRVNTISK